jgi:hypothetical protein
MSVQTRSQLQGSAATITNETAAGANTASRVGGLFDDLADTATLDRERGFASLHITSPISFTPTLNTAVKITSTMTAGIVSTYNFTQGASSITYTGLISAAVRVAAQVVFTGQNNQEYIVYIAKNGSIISQSAFNQTTQGSHSHGYISEAYLNAATSDEFTVYVNAVGNATAISIKSLTFTAHTL